MLRSIFSSLDTNPRFDLQGLLGHGGMGYVLLARDHVLSQDVALKTLTRLSGEQTWRLKAEFRQLTELCHPNLVTLHELTATDDGCWFSMEYVKGVDFSTWIRPGPTPSPTSLIRFPARPAGGRGGRKERAIALRQSLDLLFGDDPTRGVDTITGTDGSLRPDALVAPPTVDNAARWVSPDFERLGRATLQLARGLAAVHAAGKLHRDVKPSNILIDESGRLVLLDFGLAIPLDDSNRPVGHRAAGNSAMGNSPVVGTPGYMAPEQAAGGPAQAASDWYSVGILLYRALTGQCPRGSSLRPLLAGASFPTPLIPGLLNPAVPKAWSALTMRLLQPKPEDRPSGGEIIKWVERLTTQVPPAVPTARPSTTALVARHHEQAALEATSPARPTHPVIVHVYGPAGIGKTALIDHWGRRREDQGALVLRGRCHPREHVPFNALDPLIDALSAWLCALPRSAVDAIRPPDSDALVRLFPVLERVSGLRSLTRPRPEGGVSIRIRGTGALRALLRSISHSRRLVLLIDDLQWADTDSGTLLRDLLRPPLAPVLTIVLAYRSDEAGSSALRGLLHTIDGELPAEWRREVHVGPLPREASIELASRLLSPEIREEWAARIAAEAAGNPLLVEQLAQHLGAGEFEGPVQFQDVIAGRCAGLGEPARHYLELLAVAGGELDLGTLFDAAERREDPTPVIAQLRQARLVRHSRTRRGPSLQTQHDRISEAVLAGLSNTERRRRHAQLAGAIRLQAHPDPNTLLEHYEGAGAETEAGQFAVQAADQAAATLAFDRAITLYRRALALRCEVAEPWELHARLGKVLTAAGRRLEAARAFECAADGRKNDLAASVPLRRQSAEQYLRAGHVEEALVALRAVLESVEISVPQGRRSARLQARLNRSRARWTPAVEPSRTRLPAPTRRRINALTAAIDTIGPFEPALAEALSARRLLEATRSGCALERARAVAEEGVFAAARPGRRAAAEASRLLARAKPTLLKHPDSEDATHYYVCAGRAAWFQGRWADAINALSRAGELAADLFGPGRADACFHLPLMRALASAGDTERLAFQVAECERLAAQRGEHLLAKRMRRGPAALLWLADGQIDALLSAPELSATADRSATGYRVDELHAQVEAELYRGRGDSARRLIELRWASLEQAGWLSTAWVGASLWHLRARVELSCASASEGRARQAGVAQAVRMTRQILAGKVPVATPLAHSIQAAAAALRGALSTAVEHLTHAVAGYEHADMAIHRETGRVQLGGLLGGETGAQMQQSASNWLKRHGVREPKAFCGMLLPGLSTHSP